MKTPLLTGPQLGAEFAARPGLIPVSVGYTAEHPSARILWLDLDCYHCYEGFFDQSIAMYSAMVSRPPARFETALEALENLPPDSLVPPSGFIFHASRSGSTLLAKVLARSRDNIVYSETAVHNGVWKVLPQHHESAVELYRRLLLAMGRRRLASYRSHFVKFTSWNILRFDFIRAAFPETPAIFLFRHPDAILHSSSRNVQPWLGADIGFGRIWNDAGTALRDCFEAALAIRAPGFRCLDYSCLTAAYLPRILRFFQYEPRQADVALMLSEFRWDAKTGPIRQPFRSKETAAGLADPVLLAQYRSLAARSLPAWADAE